MQFSAGTIATMLGGQVDGNEQTLIHTFCKIDDAVSGGLSFLSNPKYEPYIYQTKASAVLVSSDFQPKEALQTTLIRVENPYAALSKLLTIYKNLTTQRSSEISKHAVIAPDVEVGDDVYVGDFVTVQTGSKIGKNVQLHPKVSIGRHVEIGENTVLFAGVTVYDNCKIGSNCILHAGVVIGSDGFGFAPQADGSYATIPQIGNVVIEDNVSIGANSTVDCATFGSTIIRKGVKIDNLVQIAHNVEIGEHTVIASQSGVAGSAKVGKYCVIGGQVGIAGHITIANHTKVGGQSGITSSVEHENLSLNGTPAFPLRDQLKSMAVFRKLPIIEKRIKTLEKSTTYPKPLEDE